jgi:hypothetical protein
MLIPVHLALLLQYQVQYISTQHNLVIVSHPRLTGFLNDMGS